MNLNEIGGYFSLEQANGEHYHKNAIRLNTARNCFEYILRANNYKKVYIPFYTCEAILEPLQKLKLKYEFYNINKNFEPIIEYKLKENEAFLYTNYYGLKEKTVNKLAQVYKERLIVDNAQAFYSKPITGIDTFYSPRKFFGVPDGAYLYTNSNLGVTEQDQSYERILHLAKRIDLGASAAYPDFQKSEKSLIGESIKKMSRLTEAMLSSINYHEVRLKRIENYLFLENNLSSSNKFNLKLDYNEVPMVYLYYSEDPELRKRLIENKAFVATYWPNVLEWAGKDSLEYDLAKRLFPLPIDQRYSIREMKQLISLIK